MGTPQKTDKRKGFHTPPHRLYLQIVVTQRRAKYHQASNRLNMTIPILLYR